MFKSSYSQYFGVGLTLLFSTAVQAESMLDAHIKAVGGAKSIAKIKTVHRTGTVSGQTGYGLLYGSIEEIFDLSKNYGFTSFSMSTSGYAYSRTTGWNAGGAWVSDAQTGVTDMPADEASFARYQGSPSQLAAIRGQRGADALKRRGDKEFNGETCTVVIAKGLPGEFYVNQRTNLLEGMSIPGNVVMTFEDYQTVEGVQFAGKVTVNIEAQDMTLVYAYTSTKVNGKVDVAKFKRPSSNSAPAPATPPLGSFTAEQILSYFDKNGDREISKDEAPQQLKANFAYIDTNGDGVIDVKEAQVMAKYVQNSQAASTPPAAAPGPITAKQILSSMDTNGDGEITKDEASEDLKLFFGDIDANGDEAIDLKEAEVMAKYANEQSGATEPAAATKSTTAKQAIASMDGNGDEKVSKEEAPAELKPYFSQFDSNDDGAIDANEIGALLPYINTAQGKSKKPASATEKVTAKQIISYMDKNGDGRIRKDEASKELKSNFQLIDTNGDGAIDAKEAQAMADYANKQTGSTEATPATGRYTAKQIVDSMDKNGDGEISKEEASENLKPYFAQQDSNGDGAIDLKEAQVIADYLNSQDQ